MEKCISCENYNVDEKEEARYDVLRTGFDPEGPTDDIGPYCKDCFSFTETGIYILGNGIGQN